MAGTLQNLMHYTDERGSEKYCCLNEYFESHFVILWKIIQLLELVKDENLISL